MCPDLFPLERHLPFMRRAKTPALFLSKDIVERKYRALQRSLVDARIYYALKANSDPGLARFVADLGASFEVSSEGEMNLLLHLGVKPTDIITSNPVKAPAFIRAARKQGVTTFAFDSASEVDKMSAAAPGASVFVRLAVSNEGSEWPLSHKFGVEVEPAVDLLVLAARKALRPVGINFHVGSQCNDPETWLKAIRKSRQVWDLAAERGVRLSTLNIGGGMPVVYTKPVPEVEEIGKVVRRAVAESFPPHTKIIVEPGRFLVGDAGVLATTVIGTARRNGCNWLHLDAGIFHGLMESVGGITYAYWCDKSGPTRHWVLAGPSCDSFDVIAKDVELPELQVGDRLYILSAGAYTTVYASRFNGFSLPKTHLI